MKSTFTAALIVLLSLAAFTGTRAGWRKAAVVPVTDPASEPKSQQVQLEQLQAEVKRLADLVPDQAAVMSHLSYHWTNLWFAIDQENWTLADFYLSETRANLKWAARVKPIRKAGNYMLDVKQLAEGVDNSQLAPLKKAIDAKNKKECIHLYEVTLSACYACHVGADKPYLRPRIPVAPETRAINFDPKAKEPQ